MKQEEGEENYEEAQNCTESRQPEGDSCMASLQHEANAEMRSRESQDLVTGRKRSVQEDEKHGDCTESACANKVAGGGSNKEQERVFKD